MENEVKSKRIHKIFLGILVTIIISGFVYQAWGPILNDYFPKQIDESKYTGYELIMRVVATDEDHNDTLHFKVVSVFPEHDIIANEFTGEIYINRKNIKYDTYKFWVHVYDKMGKGPTEPFIIKDIKKILTLN